MAQSLTHLGRRFLTPALRARALESGVCFLPGNLADCASLRFVVELQTRARLFIDELQQKLSSVVGTMRTRPLGLKPSCSSHFPCKRIFGNVFLRQASPESSTFRVRVFVVCECIPHHANQNGAAMQSRQDHNFFNPACLRLGVGRKQKESEVLNIYTDV